MFLGRGFSYPIALEGALKLKELSYIHAEGYPAGEMKHGPLALIEEGMPVVVILYCELLLTFYWFIFSAKVYSFYVKSNLSTHEYVLYIRYFHYLVHVMIFWL